MGCELLLMGWWVGCYVWYSEEGPGRTATPPSPLLAVPNEQPTHQLPVYRICCIVVCWSAFLICPQAKGLIIRSNDDAVVVQAAVDDTNDSYRDSGASLLSASSAALSVSSKFYVIIV